MKIRSMKNIKHLTRELCRREGLKKQVNIAQVSELVGHLSDLFNESCGSDFITLTELLIANGIKRDAERYQLKNKKKTKK